MPTYEYRCTVCGHRFVEYLTVAEHETFEPTCPECGSREVERVLSTFFAKTSRKA